MQNKALYAGSIGVAVVALSLSIYSIWDKRVAAATIPRALAVTHPKSEDLRDNANGQTARQLQALELRMRAQEQAGVARSVGSADPVNAEPPASAPTEAQTLADRTLFFETNLEAEPRDATARVYEKTLGD